jgi:hypothetical protein
MSCCLSDQALLECYTGEGQPDAMAHLKHCLACAGRYKALQGDMTLISQSLEMAPPWRRVEGLRGFAGWRIAASAFALAAAFTVGWSLRSLPVAPSGQIAARQPALSAPIEVSSLENGPTPAVYAEYVQGAFEGDSCTDDPLGCQ